MSHSSSAGASPPHDDHEIEFSLDELGRAYARAMGLAPHEIPGAAEAELPSSEQTTESSGDGKFIVTPRGILEAILFVGVSDGSPLTSSRLAQLIIDATPEEVDQWVKQLNEQYAEQNAAYRIATVGGGYRMILDAQLEPVRSKFYGRVREARLSQSAIDVLAIVAYHQPVTRQRVDALRGRPSGAVLNQLVRRQLLSVQTADGPDRVKTFRTSERFLEVFGLADLDELPQTEDVEGWEQ